MSLERGARKCTNNQTRTEQPGGEIPFARKVSAYMTSQAEHSMLKVTAHILSGLFCIVHVL